MSSGRLAAGLLSFLLFALFVAVWHVATLPGGGGQ
ncbi:MAG: nitrate ABC transporter, permease protein, partial [Betaproteobacteria bacterium]|nr:nitrate ABC transporter, permease protein [Betaproteobacteria bacterium]